MVEQDKGKWDASAHSYDRPEPVGLAYIGGSLRAAGFSVALRSWIELEAWLPTMKESRLSFISATTAEWPHAVRTAEDAKRRGNLTIVGGYHPTGVEQHDLNETPFDYLVKGEGEHVSVALAKALLHGRPVDATLDGSADRVAGRFITARRIEDLDSLAFPLRSERFLAGKICDLMYPPVSRQQNFALVVASRGCKHGCSFCAASTMWGREVRKRSPENVVEELRSLKEEFGTNTVVFADLSLGQDRAWTIDLCRAIKAAQLGIHWYPLCNMSIDREVLRAMADAGCTKIGFGVEGLSPRAVERLKPQNPHDFDVANDLFGYCNSLGILVKAFFMIGHPWETREIVQEYFEWLPRLRANHIKLMFFTPFPGTSEWPKHRDKLVSERWEDFDTFSLPVVKNPEISVEAYRELRRELIALFYESGAFIDVTRNMLAKYPHYAETFSEFVAFLRENGIANVDASDLRLSSGSNGSALAHKDRQAFGVAACK